ncbi:MAG: anti-sigma factor antagonist [Atopobium sp.]|uniref:anti-sigma factor antagonist n=1 Tax=Atopobium sp. TaxID=1872650 RepID=UPI002A75EB85|nr:anti-sigma factor antagonist [Atopobium sp.]MDY2789095.1 anti-sigma factor antagonist [Atopobium sp.]
MTHRADIVVLPLCGDLDVVSTPRARATIDDLIEGGCKRIIINMSDVSYVDSAGMAMLFYEMRQMRKAGGLLSLRSVSDSVYRALCIACVVDVIPVSLAGRKVTVPVLDASVRPLWQSSMIVYPNKLAEARAWAIHMLERVSLSRDDIFDMTLAAGEALGNAVDHAHCSDGCIYLTLATYPDRVVVEVSDCGCGYTLLDGEEAVSETGSEERGRGIRLMRMLVDSVSIQKKQGGSGTVVHMEKLLNYCELPRVY